jgi:hypothetical protein
MSRGELTIELFDRPTEHKAIVVTNGRSWTVACIDLTGRCKARILGYETRARAIKGAEWHLRWHGNGEPTCRDCGQWLSRKGSTRCRAGTCEVTE